MFDYIYEWLKNLTTYTLLMSLIIQLIPNETYQKYIRFFCGMVLIVLLITPLFQMFGLKGEFEELYQSKEYEQMIRELEEAERVAIKETGEMEHGLEE